MIHRNIKERFFFFIVLSFYIFFMLAIFFTNLTYRSPDNAFTPLKEIHSQDGKILATNTLGYVYYVNTKHATPSEIAEANAFINKYCTHFRKRKIILKPNEYYLLHKSDVPIMDIKNNLPKLIICRRENYRFYPYGEIFAHPIGLYRDGLEFGLECYNRSISKKSNINKPIVTTLLFPLQFILHKEMKAGYLEYKCAKVHGVIQSENGEILAMVSIPDFDPLISQQIPEETLNGVIYHTFEFGSIIKFFSFILGAHINAINPYSKFNIALGAKLGKHRITDIKEVKEILTPQEILLRSSNVGTIQISELIWDKVGDFYKTLMLGEKITINNFRTAQGKIQYKGGPKYLYQHYCMGYSFRTGMLQVIRAFSMIMTGKMYNPSLIKNTKKEPIQSMEFNKNINFIIDVLLAISKTNPILKKYNVYGKTGTARIINNGVYIKNHINTSYMCMFVKNGKKYFMLLVYEQPRSRVTQACANVKITAGKIIKSIMETDL